MKKRRGWTIKRPGLWHFYSQGAMVGTIRRVNRRKKSIIPRDYKWVLKIEYGDRFIMAPCLTIGAAMDVFDESYKV